MGDGRKETKGRLPLYFTLPFVTKVRVCGSDLKMECDEIDNKQESCGEDPDVLDDIQEFCGDDPEVIELQGYKVASEDSYGSDSDPYSVANSYNGELIDEVRHKGIFETAFYDYQPSNRQLDKIMMNLASKIDNVNE